MKHTLLLMLIVSGYCYGQSEFQIYSNGLIYDQPTMKKLGNIVDSLNLKFKTCDLAHPYHSFLQGMATHAKVPNKAALKLINSNASLETYLKAYPRAVITKNMWIIQSRYENWEHKKLIEYEGLPFGYNSQTSIAVKDKKANDKTSGWIVDEEDQEDQTAFYFSKLSTNELPAEYARLVQYVDCMIDTTAKIYFPNAKGEVYQRVAEDSKAKLFIAWAEKFQNKPETPDYEEIEKKNLNRDSIYKAYYASNRAWDSLRMRDLDKRMSKSSYWRDFLKEAVDEGVETGNSDARLERYAERYIDKASALKLMRSRKVIGNCSMDQSPRYHAMNICKLAAETAQWDIFLRSHLDIMNDRFERQSDGSYAWGQRNTYLKELEQLDINAIDLLLGTALRVKNVSDNHYWGSIGRLGRALADAEDKDNLELRLLTMMQDNKLDPFNRLLMAYLFDNYSYHLQDEDRKIANKKKLNAAITQMPDYIREVLTKNDKSEN